MTAGGSLATDEWDFFVSYTGADTAWAEWISWQLEAAGYRVLVQAWDLVPGTKWAERMQAGLTRATRVIAVLSSAYVASSRFTAAEWQSAWASDPDGALRRLILVRVADCDRPGLLGQVVGVDVFDVAEATAATQRLLSAIADALKGRAKPATAPPFPGAAGTAGTPFTATVTVRPPFPGALPAVWSVPLRNPNFTGRVGDLTALQAGLAGAATMTVQAVRGMGGIGKTQLAIEYAYRYAGDYDLVWWFNTEQATAMAGQVAALGGALGLPEFTDPDAMRLNVVLELRRRTRWLLIFDNAETRDQVQPLLPGGTGHVLITTRRDGFRSLGGVVDLDLLDRVDAVRLLRRGSPHLTEADAGRIADRLGDLPLALDQAAAYLDHTGMNPRDYLALLDVRTREMLARGGAGDYRHTVATVWALAIDRLRDHTPAAVELLDLCAWLAPDPIPLDLFTSHPDLLPTQLAAVVADPLAMTDMIAAVLDYALARRITDGLVLHRLVQDITRHTQGTQDTAPAPLETVLLLLRATLPDDVWTQPDTWPTYRRLLPHLITTTRLTMDRPGDPDTIAWLLIHTGTYLRRMGQPAKALRLNQRALAIHEATLGADHPDVANDLNQVGLVLSDLGRHADALPLLRRALAIREAALGADHPGVANDLNHVGWELSDLGRHAEALPLQQRALAIDEAALGADHPRVATDLNYLGLALSALGRHAEALPLQQRALAIDEAALGADHPRVATDLNHVGWELSALGRHAEAEACFQRANAVV